MRLLDTVSTESPSSSSKFALSLASPQAARRLGRLDDRYARHYFKEAQPQ